VSIGNDWRLIGLLFLSILSFIITLIKITHGDRKGDKRPTEGNRGWFKMQLQSSRSTQGKDTSFMSDSIFTHIPMFDKKIKEKEKEK